MLYKRQNALRQHLKDIKSKIRYCNLYLVRVPLYTVCHCTRVGDLIGSCHAVPTCYTHAGMMWSTPQHSLLDSWFCVIHTHTFRKLLNLQQVPCDGQNSGCFWKSLFSPTLPSFLTNGLYFTYLCFTAKCWPLTCVVMEWLCAVCLKVMQSFHQDMFQGWKRFWNSLWRVLMQSSYSFILFLSLASFPFVRTV